MTKEEFVRDVLPDPVVKLATGATPAPCTINLDEVNGLLFIMKYQGKHSDSAVIKKTIKTEGCLNRMRLDRDVPGLPGAD